ncbi:hypothetical protein K503DRAFT_554078 [Rhizopogon vinicolor AM-OR11-026]|uniref:Uncharacterized protein n=1 Tax=Rhizopogon vinicolor AM-OR11-026 TaxID=1314800 RepID=A0A1B7N831_9AGAM|nr:hypothetical protein K503DRAFT_554078 [Rhizopogon vinicolor AM-OR11-026]
MALRSLTGTSREIEDTGFVLVKICQDHGLVFLTSVHQNECAGFRRGQEIFFLGPGRLDGECSYGALPNADRYKHCERRYENIAGEKNTITVAWNQYVNRKTKKSTILAAFSPQSRPWMRFFPVRRFEIIIRQRTEKICTWQSSVRETRLKYTVRIITD